MRRSTSLPLTRLRLLLKRLLTLSELLLQIRHRLDDLLWPRFNVEVHRGADVRTA